MNKLATISAAILIAGPVMAGTPEFVPAPLPPVAGPIIDWSGPYAGVQVGYGFGAVSFPPQVFGNTTIDHFDMSGFLYGAHIGYNYDFGSLVIGAEVDYNLADVLIDDLGVSDGDDAALTSLAHLKARVGYDLGSALVYGVAGMASATIENGSEIDQDIGYFAGAGLDYRVNSDWTLGVEYLYHTFNEFNDDPIDVELHTIHARASFHF